MPALVILLGKNPRHHDLVSASLALLLSYHLTIEISRDTVEAIVMQCDTPTRSPTPGFCCCFVIYTQPRSGTPYIPCLSLPRMFYHVYQVETRVSSIMMNAFEKNCHPMIMHDGCVECWNITDFGLVLRSHLAWCFLSCWLRISAPVLCRLHRRAATCRSFAK